MSDQERTRRRWWARWFGRPNGSGARPDEGPLSCHEVGEALQEYLDGYIDDERARRIEEHLEVCRRCGIEAEAYERIKATLAARRDELPSDAVERLREFGERLARGEEPSPS